MLCLDLKDKLFGVQFNTMFDIQAAVDVDPLSSAETSIKSRLRSCRRSSQNIKRPPFTAEDTNLPCHKLAKLNSPSTGPGSGEPRHGYRRSARLNPSQELSAGINGFALSSSESCSEEASHSAAQRLGGGPVGSNPSAAGVPVNIHEQQQNLQQQLQDLQRRSSEIRISQVKRQQANKGGRSNKYLTSQPSTSGAAITKSDQPSTSTSHRNNSNMKDNKNDNGGSTPRVMTRALKRKLESNSSSPTTSSGSPAAGCKSLRLDRSQVQQPSPVLTTPSPPHPSAPTTTPQSQPPPPSYKRLLMGVGRSRRDDQTEHDKDEMDSDMQGLDDSVIKHEDWLKDRKFMDDNYPASVCREGEVGF